MFTVYRFKYVCAPDVHLVESYAGKKRLEQEERHIFANVLSIDIADTMICGSCRFVTADYEAFKDHRIAGCNRNKGKDEPNHIKCASCDNRFKSAWGLLCHLTEFHRMMLYKIDEEPNQPTSNEMGSKPESGVFPSSSEGSLKETPEKSRGAALEPTLQQPRTPQAQDIMQSFIRASVSHQLCSPTKD
ncbi:hypothetical protein OSTOST_24652 [Ostertagia ostertagi]